MVDIQTLGQGSVLAVWFLNVICLYVMRRIRKPGFDTRVFREGFMVDIQTLGQGSLLAVWFLNVISLYRTVLHPSSWAVDPIQAARPVARPCARWVHMCIYVYIRM